MQPEAFQFQPVDLKTLSSDRTADIPKPSSHNKRYRIERDHTQGEICRFSTELPAKLTESGDTRLLDQETFKNMVEQINQIYHDAESPGFWNTFEALLSLVTCQLSLCLCRSHYERKMRDLDSFVEHQNKLIFEPAGFKLISPRLLASMYLELVDLQSVKKDESSS